MTTTPGRISSAPAATRAGTRSRLQASHPKFRHHELDIRNPRAARGRPSSPRLKPGLLVHAAAQPSHDLGGVPASSMILMSTPSARLRFAQRPARRHVPEIVFAHMSTNKVYGDRPNTIRLKELATRWDYDDAAYVNGITEEFPIDQSKHSLFGASKVAADVMVQEYGRYFGMKTCCLRGGGLTGPNHSGVELHGFLSYLVKCNVEGRLYRVFDGYPRKAGAATNIHSLDVARFIHAFVEKPRCGEVYNIGGGRANSVSILEAFDRVAALSGKKMEHEYVDQNRAGDHICYISDLAKMKAHYPGWDITKNLDDVFREIHEATVNRKTLKVEN